MRFVVLVGLLVFALSAQGQIQEVKFTQFFNFPVYYNAAVTANMKEDYRISGIYRKQWNAINSEFVTFGASGEWKFDRGFSAGDSWGIGVYMLDDHLGQNILQHQEVAATIAYHHSLDFQGRHILSAGAGFNYSNNSLDISKLLFESQFDGFSSNVEIPNGESFSNDQFSNYDATLGLNYKFLINKRWSTSVGASWLNMIKPANGFFADSVNTSHMNHKVVTGSVRYQLTDKLGLSPKWMVNIQQKDTELSGGVVADYLVSPQVNFKLDGGILTQFSEYVSLYAGGDYKGFEVHVSYDFSISGLKEIAEVTNVDLSRPGVFELSFIYKGIRKSKASTYTVPCRIF